MGKFPVLLAAALATTFVVEPASGVASNETRAHANMCMPATNDLTRTTFGIRNNTTGNRSVYCGFEVREDASTGYSTVGLALRNYGGVARTVSCFWTSGQPYDGGYSSVTTTIELPADGGLPHSNYTAGLTRPNQFATLGLRCPLPPGVAMDLIEIVANAPPPE